jgi:putative membrane protein
MGTFHWENLLGAVVYSALGVVMLLIAWVIVDKATPRDLWHLIAEEKNTAVAIVIGSVLLGIAIIIAAAVH